MKNKIKVIALIGKSGAGKDYLLHELLNTGNYHEIISCTTRPPREGEENGKNYYFIDFEEFSNIVSRGEMLENTCFNGWFYGTPLSSLSEEKTNVGVFNPEGIRKLLKIPYIDVDVRYVVASDKTRLIRQLNREKNPNIAEIIRRYHTDEKDFENLDFPYTPYWNEPLDNYDQ